MRQLSFKAVHGEFQSRGIDRTGFYPQVGVAWSCTCGRRGQRASQAEASEAAAVHRCDGGPFGTGETIGDRMLNRGY